MRNEWPGLAASRFEAVGRFGIGFFSVFMLGDKVRVISRRLERSHDDHQDQWVLEFRNGTAGRPMLRPPAEGEKLSRHGTRVSVRLAGKEAMLLTKRTWLDLAAGFGSESIALGLPAIVGALAPALEIDLWARDADETPMRVVTAGDWRNLDSLALLERISPVGGEDGRTWARTSLQRSAERLDFIFDADNRCWGRCAATSTSIRVFDISAGIVTVGGLFGGEINGFDGLLVGHPQEKLDRDGAIPAAPIEGLTAWANRQAERLRETKQLTLELSRTLIALGADQEHLLVVEHSGEALSTTELHALLSDTDEIWLLSERDAGHDSDDEVLKSDFERGLELDERAIVANLTASRNPFLRFSTWPSGRTAFASPCVTDVINRVVNEAWPDVPVVQELERTIGQVIGTPIVRQVTVIRRNKVT